VGAARAAKARRRSALLAKRQREKAPASPNWKSVAWKWESSWGLVKDGQRVGKEALRHESCDFGLGFGHRRMAKSKEAKRQK